MLKMLEQTQALHLCLNKTETIHYEMSLQTEGVTVGLMKETNRLFCLSFMFLQERGRKKGTWGWDCPLFSLRLVLPKMFVHITEYW